MSKKISDRFKKYIGCHTFIDLKTGELVIVSSGSAYQLPMKSSQGAQNGMLIGVARWGRKLQILVSYEMGTVFVYDRDRVKIL